MDIDYSDEQVKSALQGLEGIIAPERTFHPRLFQLSRDLGIKTVCIPNWEWFKSDSDEWKYCDLFVCQSEMTLSVLRRLGWRNTVQIPVALDLLRFPFRHIKGPGRLFVHNAGLVDADDRKGTRDTILAFRRIKRNDIRLIVRLQKETELPELDQRIDLRIGNLSDPSQLYSEGDVAVQPSKMEGNGFMVLEPLCAGMPVITLDYPPMNEYVRTRELLVRKQWFKRKAFPSQWVRQAHLRLPDIGDLARKIEWCANNDLSNVSAGNRNFAENLFCRLTLKDKWCEALRNL